jgi:ribosomal protein S18 acetylase RimI-like enzyme
MSKNLRIQPLNREQEAGRCADFMLASEPWITLGLSRDRAIAALTDQAKEVYAAHDARGLAGFVVVDMRGLLAGYVQILCVRPDCRGQGFGAALLQWAEQRIFRDSPNVFICVSSFNPGARRLYERLGFEVVGVLRELLVAGHDELLLRKTCGTWSQFRSARHD